MLLSDRPILCAAEDQLGFQPFCATLAKGLRDMAPAEGMVVALHAPWGSGKTSALNLLQRHLAVLDISERSKKDIDAVARMAAARPDAPSEDERKLSEEWRSLYDKHAKNLKTTVIRFNPWYYSGQENLFKAFFGVLGTELSIANNTKVAKAVARVLKRGDAAGAALGAAIGMTVGGPPGAAGGASIGGLFGKLAGDKFDHKESLEASLQQLREALQVSERRLLIVIDDIDRLMPEELRQILMLIKSLGNLPNVTYLLAYARSEVVELIARAGINNADYLEKIIQVSFELPRVNRYALRTMLFSRMDAIRKGKELKHTTRWSQAFFNHIDPCLRTPRDVTRLCNALQVVWPAVEDEVDWADLVVLEVLRTREPDIYDLVVDKLDQLTGAQVTFGDDKEWSTTLVPTAETSKNPKGAKDALIYLFPRLEKAWDPNSYHFAKDDDALRSRRLQCAEYAGNYFALAPSPDQFSAAQVRNLITAMDSRTAFDELFEIARNRKTRQGLTMVSRLLLQIKEEITADSKLSTALAQAILSKSDEIVRIRDGERMLFEISNELRLSWILVQALRVQPETQRAASALEWFNGLSGAATLVRFISTMTSKSGNADYIFVDSDFEALRAQATATVRSLSEEADFLRKPQCASLLFSWGQLAGFEEVAAWLKVRLKDDQAVLELAAIMPSEVYSSPGGLWHRIDRQAWGLMLDVDDFIKRLRKIGKSREDDADTAEIIKIFEAALAKENED